MKLELGNGEVFEDPSAEVIDRALHTLRTDEYGYAILSRGDVFYIQTGRFEHGFYLEYREGTSASHRRCTDEQLPIEKVIGAFQIYAKPSDEWKSWFQWEAIFAADPTEGRAANEGWEPMAYEPRTNWGVIIGASLLILVIGGALWLLMIQL